MLATVVGAKAPKPGLDFFPLTVNYQEKDLRRRQASPAAISSAKAARPRSETLISRLIDRPIRPLFPEGYRNETQVIVTVLSTISKTTPTVPIVAASAALTFSGIPFMGPVGAARVGYINGAVRAQPAVDEMKDSTLDLVVAGTADAVLMVESEAKELSEDMMLGAVMFGHAASSR